MIKSKSNIKIKTGEVLYLIPFGDVHKGHRDARLDEFERMLKITSKQNCVWAGLGDIFDSIAVHDIRFQLSQLAGMEQKDFIDDIIDQHVKEFTALWAKHNIPPERVLFIAMGNHEEAVQKRFGTNPTKRFCEQSGITYGGYSGFHTLHLDLTDGTGEQNKTYNVNIFYHHGYGGGSRTGGYPITKYEKELMWSDADIFLFGHDHRRHLQPYAYQKCALYGDIVYKKRRVLAICGGYLDNRPQTEYPGYAESRMYPATDIGFTKIPIVITCKRHEKKTRRVVEFPVFET